MRLLAGFASSHLVIQLQDVVRVVPPVDEDSRWILKSNWIESQAVIKDHLARTVPEKRARGFARPQRQKCVGRSASV
jgi:hypothetical protein